MVRRNPIPRKRANGALKKTKEESRAQAISDTLAELDRLEAVSPTSKSLIRLFRDWLTDESGYDEQTWPTLKKALERERRRVGARRLFDA